MPVTIDVHHHILPDFFWRETNDSAHPVGGIAPPPWDEAGTLGFMDDAGIDVAITSISTPGVHVGDDARARSLARRCNEFSASLIQRWPDRFGGYAALPLPDVDGALAELAYADDVLNLDGVVLFSNSNGVYLGDDRFKPLFEELERRRAVVFVHSNGCRIRLSTSPPTPRVRLRRCSIRTGSPKRRMSNISSPMPVARSPT
jgi:6-methylsalicylate decarboxylase